MCLGKRNTFFKKPVFYMMPAKKPSMLTLVLIGQDVSLSLELPKSADSCR